MPPIAPGDGDNGETVAADDGFERKFDGDVEVGRKDGADAVDDFFAVGFEGVGGVVEAVAEEEAHEGVGQAVHEELDGRVIDGAAALHEAAAEDAVVAFVEFFPVTDDVAAVVGFVGHKDDGGVTGHGVEAEGDRPTETVRAGILHAVQNPVGSSAFAFAAANVYGVTRRRFRRGDRRQGTGDRAIKAGCFFLEDFPGAVGGAVVDDNDFMRDASEF